MHLLLSCIKRCLLSGLLLALCTPAIAQPTVAVARVKPNDIRSELTLNGNVVAKQQVGLSSEAAAPVDAVLVEIGDRVLAGQPLLELRRKPTELELEIKQAEAKSDAANLQIAEIEERRLKKLLAQKSVSAESYDQALARLQQAQAQLIARKAEVKSLKDALSRLTITAPFDGIVTSRTAEVGAWANIGQNLLSISSLHDLRLEIALPEKYFAQFNKLLTGSKIAEAKNDITVSIIKAGIVVEQSAKIQRLLAFADNSRSFGLWIAIENSTGEWIPGMTAQANLKWPTDRSLPLSVPRDAIVRRADGSALVWKLDQIEANNNKTAVTPVPVKLGNGQSGNIALQSDMLEINDLVVTRGNESLTPGQLVKPIRYSEVNE